MHFTHTYIIVCGLGETQQYYYGVDDVTILELNDKDILSQIMQSDNVYHRIVSVMKQATQEYYNMRMVLGLEFVGWVKPNIISYLLK